MDFSTFIVQNNERLTRCTRAILVSVDSVTKFEIWQGRLRRTAGQEFHVFMYGILTDFAYLSSVVYLLANPSRLSELNVLAQLAMRFLFFRSNQYMNMAKKTFLRVQSLSQPECPAHRCSCVFFSCSLKTRCGSRSLIRTPNSLWVKQRRSLEHSIK